MRTKKGGGWWRTMGVDLGDGQSWGKWVEVGKGLEVRVKAEIKEVERVGYTCILV